ncbi:MAG: NPCBM/NEW2 domain-containing protein [Pirellulales bacterium]|nr:NPCBM/NEW2 domain-containing protein [Pirellulales bacterium]
MQFSICNLHFLSAAELVSIDEKPFDAELIGATADWRLQFRADGRTISMPAADLVRWGHCPGQGRAGGLLTGDGSWIAARVLSADKEQLTAESDSFGVFSVLLESIAVVSFNSPLSLREGQGVRAERIGEPLNPHPNPFPKGEGTSESSPLPQAGEGQGVRALLKNGDVLPGQLLSIEKNVVKLQTDLGTVEIPADRINAILLPIKPRPAVAPRSFRAWIGLNDGSLLLAAKLVVENGSATFTVVGRTWKTPLENVVFLQPLGGRATYLSDLEPAEYVQTPYLDPPWPWLSDRNVAGGRLAVGGKHYMKGIGVHGAARLVYKIGEFQGVRADRTGKPLNPHPDPLPEEEGTSENSPLPLEEGTSENSPLPLAGEGPGVRAAGATTRFQALVAIDDSTDNRGSARFRVLVDGQEKYASPIVRGGDKPLPVNVDITGAERLELVVDYADRADVLDYADWLEARIVWQRAEEGREKRDEGMMMGGMGKRSLPVLDGVVFENHG